MVRCRSSFPKAAPGGALLHRRERIRIGCPRRWFALSPSTGGIGEQRRLPKWTLVTISLVAIAQRMMRIVVLIRLLSTHHI
jgi:hypothetical protein